MRLTMILVLGAILGVALGIGLPAAMGTPDDYSARVTPSLIHRSGAAGKTDGLRLEPARLIDHF